MKTQGPTIDVDGKKTTLWYFTGKVLSSKKQKETQISSRSLGTQNNPQVHVTSTTVDHHELFLIDDQGKEDSFQLVDFDFPCREGQTLTLVWAIPEGADRGPYICAHNHNTGESHRIAPNSIADRWRKPGWMVWGIGLVLVIVTIPILSVFCLFSVLISFFYFRWRSRKAVKDMLASRELSQLEAQFSQVKPLAA
jgi:hypothetical protein